MIGGTFMPLQALREQVMEVCLKMLTDGLVKGSEGNISARDPQSGFIVITPSAIPYVRLKMEDLCILNEQYHQVEGNWKPTSELALHTIFYQRRPEVNAVVHTHAPFVSAFAISGEPLPMVLSESAMLLGGTVPVAPYRTPGTPELAEVTAEALGTGLAAVMAHHGSISVGRDLNHAYTVTMAAEQTARMIYLVRSMNAPLNVLPDDVCASLHSAFLEKYHPTRA
jgi:L-fuculose-phosphate aldolase